MRTETRKRLSRGSFEVQVSHSQPMEGTPVDVPVPRKVSFMIASNVQCPKSKVKLNQQRDFGLWTLDYLPPVMSLLENARGVFCVVAFASETYCMRKSANSPSRICFS